MLSSFPPSSTAGTHRPSGEPVTVRRPIRRLELRHLLDRDLDRTVSVRDLADAVRAAEAGRRRGRADLASKHLLTNLRGLHQSDVSVTTFFVRHPSSFPQQIIGIDLKERQYKNQMLPLFSEQ